MKNLADITMQETVDLELVHPRTFEGLGTWFKLAGPEHPDRRRYELEKDRKLRSQVNRKGSIQLDDPEEDRRQLVEYLAECTLGWYTIVKGAAAGAEKIEPAADFGQGPVPYSKQAARQVFDTPALRWIRDQVREGVAKTDLFIKDSSSSSSNTGAGSPDSPN